MLDVIAKKYDCTASNYYRRRLCAAAKKISFTELPPAKSATEFANRTVERGGAFIKETDQKYQIADFHFIFQVCRLSEVQPLREEKAYDGGRPR